MKKALILSLLAATVLPLAACGNDEQKPSSYADKDFDGLYDSYDPTPDCNITGYKNNDGSLSEEISIAVDYRKFFQSGEPTYDKEIGTMLAVVANNSYTGERSKWVVTTSKYENEDSKINPVLVQFGFNDIKYVTTQVTDGVDPNDICGIYLGNHILENNGKLYQVYMASLEGYPSDIAWISNLDLGADTQAYKEIYGDHPEWTNKKHHKGFDVTANRAYTEIKKYIDEKTNKSAVDSVVLVTGHSRGGALTNLVGKKLFDNNIKSLAYAFNGPLTTCEDDKAVLSKYTNIFNIHSSSDYIGRYPFQHMGFTSYGKNLEYDFLDNENAKIYKKVYDQDFHGNTPENLDKLDLAAKDVYPTRDGAYEFDEPRVYDVYETLDDANDELEDLNESMIEAKIPNFAKVAVVENDDEETKEENPYAVTISARPYSALMLASQIIVAANMSEDKFGDISYLLLNGLPFTGKYFGSLAEAVVSHEVEINILNFAIPHIQKTCVVGAMVAK